MGRLWGEQREVSLDIVRLDARPVELWRCLTRESGLASMSTHDDRRNSPSASTYVDAPWLRTFATHRRTLPIVMMTWHCQKLVSTSRSTASLLLHQSRQSPAICPLGCL